MKNTSTRLVSKAYIILAHKNPEQLTRLIDALDDKQSVFFVHLDKRADVALFARLNSYGDKVVMVRQVATGWASFGLVEATLEGMKAVAAYPRHFDFVSLISGQHYPIKSNDHINEFLHRSRHRVFLEYSSLPDYQRWKIRGGLYRIDKYFLGFRRYERLAAKTLNFLSSHISFFGRKFPQTMKPYAGSQWWTIDLPALHYVLNFVNNNPAYAKYHRYTFAPDELFFHNILLNAGDATQQEGITNDNLLYYHWPDVNSGHPDMLQHSHLGDILASPALFARKFDMEQDALVLDKIDESRARKQLAPVTKPLYK